MHARRLLGPLAGLAFVALLGLAVGWLRREPGRGPAPSLASIRVGAAAGAARPVLLAPGASPEAGASARMPARVEPGPEALAPAPAVPRAGQAVLQVRLLALETQEPLAGIPVLVEGPDGTPLSEPFPVRQAGAARESRTDSAGRIDLLVPAERALVLHANAREPRAGPSALLPVEPLDSGQFRTTLVELVARPELLWCGQVLDARTLAPLSEARVGFRGTFSSHPCGADGRIELHLAAEGVELCVSSPEHLPCTVAVGPGHGAPGFEQRLLLEPAATLDVIVLDSRGLALPGVRLRAGEQRTLGALGGYEPFAGESRASDARGACVLRGLPTSAPLALGLWREGRLSQVEPIVPPLAPREWRTLVVRMP